MTVPRAHGVRRSAPSVAKAQWLIAGIIALWSCPAFAATINFFQITDPHLFDCKGDVEGNKEALKWCIREINGRAGDDHDSKFIIVTGDLGLEGLPCGGDENEPGPSVARVSELAEIVKESRIKKWLFLPGNNDLVGENPKNIITFHRFIEALQKELPDIVNFCPREDDKLSGFFDRDGCRFIGFNNASFKSNDSANDAESFKERQLPNVKEVLARLEPEEAYKHAYLFYHLPEIDDPYYVGMDPSDERLVTRETNRGQHAKDTPLSAWTVAPDIRKEWNGIVGKEKVRGLFAGHFHSSKQDSYEGFGWLKNREYASASLPKLYLCPPVASKKQEKEPAQARGFREVSIDSDTGKITSNIVWYKPKTAPFQIVEKDLVLSVDPANNTASGLFHLTNNTAGELNLSLSAEDFKTSSGHGLNAKTLFAPASPATAGQPVLTAKLPASGTIAVRVDVSNFWEAGEATAKLCNYGAPFGKLRATKWRPPFAVKIMSPTPDKPELPFTKGKPRQVALKNDDAMTYTVALSAEVDGFWSDPVFVTLPPNGSAPVELRPHDDWFPASAWVKESVREGNIRLRLQAANAGGQPVPERVIPFKARLTALGEFGHTFWEYFFIVVGVTLGGVGSMILSNWVPNRLSRADIEEQLTDLARRTRDLSACIDSGLRVFLRVERNRLHRFLKSWWIFSANFPDVVKQCSDKIAVLSKQIDLATQLDRARLALEHAKKTSPISSKIAFADHELQKAADLLRRSEPRQEDLDAAKGLIAGPTERISKMEQGEPDPAFVETLTKRIEFLKLFLQPPESDALKEIKPLLPKLFASFPPVVTDLAPSQYSSADLVTAQMELVRDYLAHYDSGATPRFPKQDEFLEYLKANTAAELDHARGLLKQIREKVFVADILRAIGNGSAYIFLQSAPIEDQLLKFSVRFKDERLNAASAQDEIRCRWDFGDGNSPETGWEAYHYFQVPAVSRFDRMRRRLSAKSAAKKTVTKKYDVTARFGAKVANIGQPKPIEEEISVVKASAPVSADRNRAEVIRLAIALIIALIGLLAGAREKLVTLDLVPAAIAVILLGFGADTIKNLISPKQTQR